MTEVLIVDDHAIVRKGLCDLVEATEDLAVAGVACDGEEAVRLAAQLAPDVILMDLSMPTTDGVAATRRIVEADPEARVVILTSFSEQERIHAALQAGAVGYLLKDAEPEDLLKGVRAAARGEAPFSPRAATALLPRRDAARDVAGLSKREREVLALVAEGLSNRQISRRLGISEKTVKAHLTSVFARTGTADRTQAALWAQRHDLRC